MIDLQAEKQPRTLDLDSCYVETFAITSKIMSESSTDTCHTTEDLHIISYIIAASRPCWCFYLLFEKHEFLPSYDFFLYYIYAGRRAATASPDNCLKPLDVLDIVWVYCLDWTLKDGANYFCATLIRNKYSYLTCFHLSGLHRISRRVNSLPPNSGVRSEFTSNTIMYLIFILYLLQIKISFEIIIWLWILI